MRLTCVVAKFAHRTIVTTLAILIVNMDLKLKVILVTFTFSGTML